MAFDWSSLIGPGTQFAGSLFGANQWGNTSDQYSQVGRPHRDRLDAISANPNAYYSSPEAQALANASDRRYSASVGNPAGSGTAQAGAMEAMMRGYGAERDRLFNYGGGGYFNRAATGARGNQIGSQMGIFNALGPLMALFQGGGGTGGGEGGIIADDGSGVEILE